MKSGGQEKPLLNLSRSRAEAAALSAAILLAACAQDPQIVASDCVNTKTCGKTTVPLQKLDKVDILIVEDTSDSIAGKLQDLKQQLPAMMNAITAGKTEEMTFPSAASIHVAVITTDMGIGTSWVNSGIQGCEGRGRDGVFVQPTAENLAGCDVSTPNYLSFEGSPGALATVDTVACVPVVGEDYGCGYEQPLEATLKALWPSADNRVPFLDASSHGHGDAENAGFLRPDSLLVVVVVTDEDDCSAKDPHIFAIDSMLDPGDPLLQIGPNVRCLGAPSGLYATQRYLDGLRALRPNNPNLIFAVIGGVPPDLLPDSGEPDFAAVLADPRMQSQIDDQGTHDDPNEDHGATSCMSSDDRAEAPRRLVEVASAFGANGVLTSLCTDDFGDTAGRLIRAIGTRLAAYADSAKR